MTISNKNEKDLFDQVVSILEGARTHVVHSVNLNMVLAYWFIGKAIVEKIQDGNNRAGYGKQVLEKLSKKLNKHYGSGFSISNLRNFRQFYQMYPNRLNIIRYPLGSELVNSINGQPLNEICRKSYPSGSECLKGFSPQLSWSHYRSLMRVNDEKARLFYEHEAITCGWDKRTLERHIYSQYYERLLSSQHPEKMMQSALNGSPLQKSLIDVLKNPYVLEFLGLPDSSTLHETDLEAAIITHLQKFLLELGKGFAFVGRQKRLHFDNTDLFVDLVFYNCILKFYMLIDLKVGTLSYKDVGQMDGYVRMFDDLYTTEDDNPTIGLILCSEKNEAVARYSVLNERKQIFASKYMLYLPTEEALKIELERERKLIEEHIQSTGETK
jgi:predicted nuclease of restriction endonuclease-like (RecB) superfamily